MTQSKLSEALALSLLKCRGIDRDTIEALCKRAAVLESACGAQDALVKSHTQLQWALRDLLAQTRDLDDRGPEGEGYQSDALENAIAIADALVGTDATEQFPVADEPLNRRIQELEVALAEEKKKKVGNVYIDKDLINFTQDGVARVRLGRLDPEKGSSDPSTGKVLSTQGFDKALEVLAAEAEPTPQLVELMSSGQKAIRRDVADAASTECVEWSEEALRVLIDKVIAEREEHIADTFHRTQSTIDELLAKGFKEAQHQLKELPRSVDVKTVVMVNGTDNDVNQKVKEVLQQELKPGGKIWLALQSR